MPGYEHGKETGCQEEDYVTVRRLTKTYTGGDGKPLTVLSDISLNVRKGEFICIVGPSGCGKSTLLRAIAGLDPEHDGTVEVAGKQVTAPAKSRGMVYQEPRLFPWLTIEKNVAFALNGKDAGEKRGKVQELLNLVGLKGFEKSYPSQLSGGMAQRAGIARALVNNPELLLLDEPFGALDAFTKITMQKELRRIQKQEKTTMLLVTHDIDEAVYLADRIIIFSGRPGQIRRIIRVELPEPRARNDTDFLAIRREVYNEFFNDPKIQEDYVI